MAELPSNHHVCPVPGNGLNCLLLCSCKDKALLWTASIFLQTFLFYTSCQAPGAIIFFVYSPFIAQSLVPVQLFILYGTPLENSAVVSQIDIMFHWPRVFQDTLVHLIWIVDHHPWKRTQEFSKSPQAWSLSFPTSNDGHGWDLAMFCSLSTHKISV